MAKAVKKAAAKKAAVKKVAVKKVATKKAAPKKKAVRKANPALMKPLNPSPALALIVGNKPMPRGQITKQLWAYIKKHNLQDTKNKRVINADDKLKAIVGKASVDMFEMTKLVNKHIS